MMNPVFPFEISVIDMDRAVGFYEAVIGYKLRRRTVDGYEMAVNGGAKVGHSAA